MYKLLRSFLFLFNPEWVHYFSMNCLKLICSLPFGKTLIQKLFCPKQNFQLSIFNCPFPNKIGLAAGFDKNARYLNELEALGFGFVEIGTVTPIPQVGNEKPRLFRLPKDKALINRMGFNNDGAEEIAKRLEIWRQKKSEIRNLPGRQAGPKSQIIIGGNIGKNKATPNEEAWKDYLVCFEKLHPYVDYFVVNVSSPNTPGLRELQEKDSLRTIFEKLKIENSEFKIQKPILLKIAPDLTLQQLDDVIDLALEIKLDGIVACNTTVSREQLTTPHSLLTKIGAGGLSGLPVKEKSTHIIKYLYSKTGGKIPIIGSGGVFSAKDAQEKLDAGASLVQVWTGFIYEGPGIVRKICNGLS